jgi:hypothetical protein
MGFSFRLLGYAKKMQWQALTAGRNLVTIGTTFPTFKIRLLHPD